MNYNYRKLTSAIKLLVASIHKLIIFVHWFMIVHDLNSTSPLGDPYLVSKDQQQAWQLSPEPPKASPSRENPSQSRPPNTSQPSSPTIRVPTFRPTRTKAAEVAKRNPRCCTKLMSRRVIGYFQTTVVSTSWVARPVLGSLIAIATWISCSTDRTMMGRMRIICSSIGIVTRPAMRGALRCSAIQILFIGWVAYIYTLLNFCFDLTCKSCFVLYKDLQFS